MPGHRPAQLHDVPRAILCDCRIEHIYAHFHICFSEGNEQSNGWSNRDRWVFCGGGGNHFVGEQGVGNGDGRGVFEECGIDFRSLEGARTVKSVDLGVWSSGSVTIEQ